MEKNWCEKNDITIQELNSLKTILSFLSENPEDLGWRGSACSSTHTEPAISTIPLINAPIKESRL
jgi:hypothetical protein